MDYQRYPLRNIELPAKTVKLYIFVAHASEPLVTLETVSIRGADFGDEARALGACRVWRDSNNHRIFEPGVDTRVGAPFTFTTNNRTETVALGSQGLSTSPTTSFLHGDFNGTAAPGREEPPFEMI